MKLEFNWTANFFDGPQRIMLTKPGVPRAVCLSWQSPILKEIDPQSGLALTEPTVPLPESTKQLLTEAAQKRWARKGVLRDE